MQLLDTVFGTAGNIAPAQECARTVLVLAYGWIAVRLAGRRLFGKWSALDIVVSVIIGSSLSRTLTGNAPLLGTLAATSLLLAMHWALGQAAARWRTVSRVVEGLPIALVRNGQSDAHAMRRWSISTADLEEALRQRALHDLNQVEIAMLEPSGSISVIPKT